MTYAIDTTPLWKPNPLTVGDTRMAMFMQATGHGRYADLWRWSVDQPEAFWTTVWDFCGAIGERGTTVLEDGHRMPGARWFPQARVNYAENLLKNRDEGEALVFWGGPDGWPALPAEALESEEIAFWAEGLIPEGFQLEWWVLSKDGSHPDHIRIYAWEAGAPPPDDTGASGLTLLAGARWPG